MNGLGSRDTVAAQVETVRVAIPAGEVTLAGVLRVPTTTPAPRPALVFTGPFTGVKEQVVGQYAEALAPAGFVTLAFDHRNFGDSGGEPRQHEDTAGKLADLRHATSFLSGDDRVDSGRIGCVGICLGGGYALRHSAFDPRIRAVALVAAAFNDPGQMREGMGRAAYRGVLEGLAAVEQHQFQTGEIEYLPAVAAPGQGEAAMGGAEPFEYYGTSRSHSPAWVNRVTRLSIRELLTFDAATAADFLAPTPALVIHGRRDDYCSPAAAQAIHDRISAPKEMMWLDTTNHIDLYDQAQFVDRAVARIREWMLEHL